jgi:hypothetical protein
MNIIGITQGTPRKRRIEVYTGFAGITKVKPLDLFDEALVN